MDECLDFYSIMRIIRFYAGNEYYTNRLGFYRELFSAYSNDLEVISVISGPIITRWEDGEINVSEKILEYYSSVKNEGALMNGLADCLFPLLLNVKQIIAEMKTLVLRDDRISEAHRQELLSRLTEESEDAYADFMAGCILYAIEYGFRPREKYTHALKKRYCTSILADEIEGTSPPPPCKHFCGRTGELQEIERLLQEHNHVFLTGIPGIGKSEIAKAYAEQHKSAYSKILYFQFYESLETTIGNIHTTLERISDTAEKRFEKNLNLIENFRQDVLIIIDNYNVEQGCDPLLDQLLSFRCQFIFTSRCIHSEYAELEISEISDLETIHQIMSILYPEANQYWDVLDEIIKISCHHTMVIELTARVLKVSMYTPDVILESLRNNLADDGFERILFRKDGKTVKQHYREHIHTLLSMIPFSDMEITILRNLSLLPSVGIDRKEFSHLINLRNFEDVNSLADRNMIQCCNNIISLHCVCQLAST